MGILCTGFITPLKIWLQGFFMCPQECLMSLQLKFNFRFKKKADREITENISYLILQNKTSRPKICSKSYFFLKKIFLHL